MPNLVSGSQGVMKRCAFLPDVPWIKFEKRQFRKKKKKKKVI